MRKRIKKDFKPENTRLMDVQQFMEYTSTGRNSSLRYAKEIGAIRKIGNRTLIDKKTVDEFLDTQAREEQ